MLEINLNRGTKIGNIENVSVGASPEEIASAPTRHDDVKVSLS